MKLSKEVKVEFNVTPHELADLFLDMSALQQAEFFNRIGHVVTLCEKEASKHSKAEREYMSWANGVKSFRSQLGFIKLNLSENGKLIFNCFKYNNKVNK